MTYISVDVDVDIDDIFDELDDDDLIKEIEKRAKIANVNTFDFIRYQPSKVECDILEGRMLREQIAHLLGLNQYASKDDIINMLLEKI
ncbi:MAG: hypothetical protein PHV53_11680 [Fermentimonas sp.]|nr:hypothetical protein [Fermentimonas sp.]